MTIPDRKIFRYVVRYDGGTAPRPYGGVCSLAICKPRIRASAQVGDWLIGFRSRQPGEVLYAMEVTERLTLGEYWEDVRFRSRRPDATPKPDNMYRPAAGGELVQVPNDVHVPAQAAKDRSGRNVLLSDCFWYFGRENVPLPNHLMHLVHTTQGHAVHVNRRPDDVQQLRTWLASWPMGMLGAPVDCPDGALIGEDVASGSMEVDLPKGSNPVPGKRPKLARSCAPASSPAKGSIQPPARIVISRKGFDSGYGGIPSPILRDGQLLSLPIPARHDQLRMSDLRTRGVDLGALLVDLSGGRHDLSSLVHLDPDLDRNPEQRLPGWRPSFGQSGTAQSHLAANGVGAGDVFLFFGWFRQVERFRGRWRYARSAPNLHVLFGWLEIDQVLPVVNERERCLREHPWIAGHPHVQNPSHYDSPSNTVYIAPKKSSLLSAGPGGGVFPMFHPDLQLTAQGKSRSVWSLPRWMMPSADCAPLTYHGKSARWAAADDRCHLRTVAKGQEFVLQAKDYPASEPWLEDLLHAALPGNGS